MDRNIEDRDADDNQTGPLFKERRTSRLWSIWGKRVPRSEIVFFCQMLIIYAVVTVSLFNLSRGNGTEQLWIALLGSCLGYVLPNPSIDPSFSR